MGSQYDILVIGGGNAAVSAAITARRMGRRVLVLEAAPKDFRGGNTRHTRNFRCMHTKPLETMIETYPEDEYFDDLLRVTGGQTNEHLARMTIRRSEGCYDWMKSQGVHFQPALGGTLQLSRTAAFYLGGGKALLNAYYATAAKLGIDVLYEAPVHALELRDGRFHAAHYRHQGVDKTVAARAVVFASGGFEANFDWLGEAWGPTSANFLCRGTPYNKGACLRLLLDSGVKPVGDPTQGHMVAIDARAPKWDGGIATRVDAVSFGIVVNRDGKRFYDEGEDFWPKRYAIWGRLVAGQPDQIGYVIVDSKSVGRFMPPVFPPVRGASLEELAGRLEIDPAQFKATVAEFNAAVVPGTFDISVLDDCHTEGLTPPKSHWARTIDEPPFYSYPVRPGLTFTYLGVTVNDKAQIIMDDDKPSANMFAAGEIMAGNVLGKGYLAGIGMTIGVVFGRIAGEEAARNVSN
ncbi:MAG: FAD-dependent tricarballylate dehydrogenase TcuA [Hyphomicrobiaceae bacterium]